MSETIVAELIEKARELDSASTRLIALQRQFEGGPDGNGEWHPGPKLRWEIAVDAEIDAIYEESERSPPQDVRLARAKARARKNNPDLWSDYERLSTEINAFQKWISARKQSISARQSILSAEKLVHGGVIPS